ncbi:MAG TPA: hypothetical protein VFT12_02785 [Thermoanaerobaculia bacterium]|nr:hypothetical protein [Thermoanaerobaculia bacterium]
MTIDATLSSDARLPRPATKHGVTEVIRRGFLNTVANWPILLIRIGESILLMLIAVAAVVAVIVPVVLSLGIQAASVQEPADAAAYLLSIVADKWAVIAYVLAVVTVVLAVFVAVHSFVEAGSARVYVDGERAAGPALDAPRERFRVFSGEKWVEGGKTDWWSVFWIYNVAWGVAGLILLVPALAMLVLMFVARDNPAAVVGITCLGLAFFFLFLFAVVVVTNIWCQKAIVVCVARTHRTVGALGEAWREFRSDAGRHIGVAVILFVLMIAGSGLFASFSAIAGWNDSPTWTLAMMPMQLAGSFANSIFSTIIAAWFLACFATLAVDRR